MNITYKTEKGLVVPMHKAIFRPRLEYCIQAWRPYRRKDICMLEKIQPITFKGLEILAIKKDIRNVV